MARDFGDNAIVASICPKESKNAAVEAYGYRAAVEAIINRFMPELETRCLPRALGVDAAGHAECFVGEALLPADGQPCDCTAPGRAAASCELTLATLDALARAGACNPQGTNPPCAALCVCELVQTTGAALNDCQNSVTPAPSTAGWCYVDGAQGIGNPELVKDCPATARRRVRIVGPQAAAPGTRFIAGCMGVVFEVP